MRRTPAMNCKRTMCPVFVSPNRFRLTAPLSLNACSRPPASVTPTAGRCTTASDVQLVDAGCGISVQPDCWKKLAHRTAVAARTPAPLETTAIRTCRAGGIRSPHRLQDHDFSEVSIRRTAAAQPKSRRVATSAVRPDAAASREASPHTVLACCAGSEVELRCGARRARRRPPPRATDTPAAPSGFWRRHASSHPRSRQPSAILMTLICFVGQGDYIPYEANNHSTDRSSRWTHEHSSDSPAPHSARRCWEWAHRCWR